MARIDHAAQTEAELLLKCLPTGPVDEFQVQEFPQLSNAVRAWIKYEREPDYRLPGIHPSGLGNFCLREQVYKVIAIKAGDKVPSVRPSPETQMIFEAGHATHLWWQSRILGPMGILYGRWECFSCSAVHGTNDDIIKMPKKCDSCGAPQDDIWFKEERIQIPAHVVLNCEEEDLTEQEHAHYRVVGHCDGEIRLVNGKRYIAELKSQNKWNHPKRTEPNRAHMIQGLVYAHAKGVDGVMVIYVNKDTYAPKSYIVTGSDHVVDWLYSQIRLIKKNVDRETPHKVERVCSSKSCNRAKKCPFRHICFA